MVTNEVVKQLSDADWIYLLADFTPQEVKDAVFAIHPDKAPGADGLNAGFFQHYWDIIGQDVMSSCLSWLRDQAFP